MSHPVIIRKRDEEFHEFMERAGAEGKAAFRKLYGAAAVKAVLIELPQGYLCDACAPWCAQDDVEPLRSVLVCLDAKCANCGYGRERLSGLGPKAY